MKDVKLPFHWFVYQASDRETRQSQKEPLSGQANKQSVWPQHFGLQYVRDGAAFSFLQSALHELRCSYLGLIFNFHGAPAPRLQKGRSLLVSVTRPPLDRGSRTSVERSRTKFETELFAELRGLFAICTRESIKLSSAWGDAFPRHAQVIVSHYSPARMPDGWSIGYLVFWPHLNGSRIGYLCCFSMDATSTLVWNYLIAKTYKKELARIIRASSPQILIGEFKLPTLSAGATPADLSFVDNVKVQFYRPEVKARSSRKTQ
jgi:hypothetical protein